MRPVKPEQYLDWLGRYFSGPRPLQVVSARLSSWGPDVGRDVVQSTYLALHTTATNKIDRGEDFWMATDDDAERYTLRALRNQVNRHLRGLIDDSARRSAGGDDDLVVVADRAPQTTSAPSDPQHVLDSVALAVEEVVETYDRGMCPRCGRGPLLGILAGIVEAARDQLDPDYEEDEFDAVTRVDAVARAAYRAIGRLRGIDSVLRPDGIDDAAAQLVSRCRPCVERILDDVVAWVVGTPEDFSDRMATGDL